MADGNVSKTGVAIQLSGGSAGPDGIEMGADDPYHHLDNIAFGGPEFKTLYITEALSGDILTVEMPVAGKKLYGLI